MQSGLDFSRLFFMLMFISREMCNIDVGSVVLAQRDLRLLLCIGSSAFYWNNLGASWSTRMLQNPYFSKVAKFGNGMERSNFIHAVCWPWYQISLVALFVRAFVLDRYAYSGPYYNKCFLPYCLTNMIYAIQLQYHLFCFRPLGSVLL